MTVIIAGSASHGHMLAEVTFYILKVYSKEPKPRMIQIIAGAASHGQMLAEITFLKINIITGTARY